jgi:hypothetical protein
VALNHGLHPLIQYLYFSREERELLTARADAPKLMRTSKEILDRLSKDMLRQDERVRASLKNRMFWLSRFFYGPIEVEEGRWVRRVGAAVLALLLGGFVLRAALEASEYHATYVERMSKMAFEAASGQGAGSHEHQPGTTPTR